MSAAHLRLAVESLVRLARLCVDCAGTGDRVELFEAFIMTDDPRLIGRGFARVRHAARRAGPTAERYARGAGRLVTPCASCHDIRQVVETVGGSL